MANQTEVKKLISSVLCSSPKGLTIKNLMYDFKNLVGYELPFKSFGHPTLESYLRNIPDICEIKGSGDHAILIHVVSQNLEHMNAMIIKQKVSRVTSKRIVYRRPNGIVKQVGFSTQSKSGDICQKPIYSGNNRPVYNRHYESEDDDSSSINSNSFHSDGSVSVSSKSKIPTKYADLARYLCKQKKLCPSSIKVEDQNSKSNEISRLVKDRLRIIIKEYPTGLVSHRLSTLYRSKFNEELDPFEFNCSSISELCSMLINEVFHIVKPNRADLLLFDISLPKPNQEDYQTCNPYDINEYPSEVMILGEEFDVQNLCYRFAMSDFIPIKVVNIVDPSNFYFQYEFNDNFITRRNKFFDELQTFYLKNSRNYIIRNSHILPNLHCVVLIDNIFYRATIIKCVSDKIQVFLVDYGDIEVVGRCDLFYMMDEFANLSKQAIYAGLSCLKPGNGNEWSCESIKRFYKMVEGKKCMGFITSTDKRLGKINIIITDVTEKHLDIIINDTLIDDGHAEMAN